MKTIEETYREKLKILANEFGGQNGLSKVIGKSAAQISQWINASPDSKTGKPRSLKSETAREIERLTGKPHAWLDQPFETLPLPPEDTETIRIDHLDMAGACGDGIEADDWPSPISSVEFPLDAVRRLFSGRDTSGLKIVGTRGDSMEPTIPETSAVLIDTKTDTFAGDGILTAKLPRCLSARVGFRAKNSCPLYLPDGSHSASRLSTAFKAASATVLKSSLFSISVCPTHFLGNKKACPPP